MPHRRKVTIGIAWFRSDQWDLLRRLAADTDDLEQTHAEWVACAGKAIRDLAKQPITVRKTDVDVNVLQAWCLMHDRPLDSAARAEYASAQLRDSNERT